MTEPQLRLAPDVAYVRRGADVFVLALDRTDHHQEPLALTGSGAYIWELLETYGPIGLGALTDRAIADFPDLDPAQARTEVDAFVRALLSRGVVCERGD